MTLMCTSIKQPFLCQKGRLAGFFLCLLLSACQPASGPVSGALEFTRAEQAIRADLPLKASEHLALAIQQGHPTAARDWLSLTHPKMGPLQQYQQLQQWSLQPLPPELAATLGLWHDAAVMPPVLAAGPRHQSCQLQVQPVLSTLVSVEHWLRLQRDWHQSGLAQLPICFLAPIVLDGRELRCSEQTEQRISCDPTSLSTVMRLSAAQVLLVAAGRGLASYNNGWLQLPENFSPALFRHEFSHALGFLDEYTLTPAVAAVECARNDVLANLLLKPDDAARYARYWGLNVQELQLTPVDTCRAAGIQAWRPVQADSHMQHYELAIPELYQRVMKRQLAQVHVLMPVQYYFAYLARQQQDMQQWQVFMQQAAAFGYPAAQEALQAAGISSTAR